MRFTFFFAFASLPAVVACGGSTTGGTGNGTSGVSIDADDLCDRYVNECAQKSITLADCKKTFVAVRTSQSCADSLKSATCNDLTSATSPVQDACFPKCATSGAQTCNGDGTVTTCSSQSRTYVFDCASLCSSVLGGTYTGTCGKSYQSETSDKDKCWCK